MELARGWKILIEDIEIQNVTDSPISPFIRFTLGGNYHVSIAFFFMNYISNGSE